MQKFLKLFCGFLFALQVSYAQQLIYKSEKYQVYDNRVDQKPFSAKAISDTEIFSDYKSAANEFVSPAITFKFSINGKDNEMPSGQDHHFNCLTQDCAAPLIEFGKQLNDKGSVPANTYLKPNSNFKIKLDLRNVFKSFAEKGYFETFNGAKIFKDDFKGVYVAGNTTPLTWDFDNLHNYKHLQLQDADGDHIYEATLKLNSQDDKRVTNTTWKLTNDISAFPKYKGPFPMLNAVYNLSMDEMIRAVEKDSTLRTGKEWAGVWTRDVSYSIILAQAVLQPKVARYSLMRKVKNGVVIQDTGTGGAYPVSTDRMIWAVAAWEIYKVTGDKKWLETAYPIIKKSLEDDSKNAFDPVTGLVKGESSFLDWREQTYPTWMDPADIFESECLGTNAAHFQAHTVLANMADELKDAETSQLHKDIAAKIKTGINTSLWLNDKGYYSQFLYGRIYKTLSSKSEALGEALTVLFDIAEPDRQRKIVASTPVNEFGIPCIYPQIPNIPPYHNNGIWPFVQSYWTMACAKAGNENAVLQSLAAIYRPTALFLTNKENFVAENGDFVGTQINSDNMLWSLSGNISMVYKVLFGMEYKSDGLLFHPFVPKALGGKHSLENYKYRDAILSIELTGFGNKITSITLDGKPLEGATVPGTLKGNHKVVITLNNVGGGGTVNKVPHLISPDAPAVVLNSNKLSWAAVPNAASYLILKNGKPLKPVAVPEFVIPPNDFSEYQVVTLDKSFGISFASEPVIPLDNPAITKIELENIAEKEPLSYKGFSGTGFVFISVNKNQKIDFTITAPAEGSYVIDFRYANGNGPINTENKCALRSLFTNGEFSEAVVFPQRGTGEWSEWGFSNTVIVKLKAGENKITLAYEPFNENMNGAINEAVIDYVRIAKLK